MPKKRKKGKSAGIPALLTPRGIARAVLDCFRLPSNPAASPPPNTWRLLPWLLLAGFVLRAAVVLAGDFTLHPDEIMQYLEPAHRLVFGPGVAYWEFYYGARSWLIPALVALPLSLTKLLGVDSPAVYIPLVKLCLAAVSLLIPYGIYHLARNTLSESTARIALLLGVFWYELIGFAHKAMSEFVATSLLFLLLAWVTHPLAATRHRRAAAIVLLAVLIFAVRFQYATILFVLAVAYFLRAAPLWKTILASGAAGVFAIGVFDYATWGNWFHSYWVNLQVNLTLGDLRQGESPWYIFLLWLLLASGGAAAVLAVVAFYKHKRWRFFIVLLLFLIIPHLLQSHREYRFIFAAIPILLVLLADAIAALPPPNWKKLAAGGYLALVSVLGIFNALPFQHFLYWGFSQETGIVNFLSHHDPIFSTLQKLGGDEQVQGVWDASRVYYNGGGYYYFHAAKPFYDLSVGVSRPELLANPARYVSHIIAAPAVVPVGLVQAPSGQLAMQTGGGTYIPLPTLINDATLNQLIFWSQDGQSLPIANFEQIDTVGSVAEGDDRLALSIWQKTNDEPIVDWEEYVVYPDNEAMHNLIEHAVSSHARPSTPHSGINLRE